MVFWKKLPIKAIFVGLTRAYYHITNKKQNISGAVYLEISCNIGIGKEILQNIKKLDCDSEFKYIKET